MVSLFKVQVFHRDCEDRVTQHWLYRDEAEWAVKIHPAAWSFTRDGFVRNAVLVGMTPPPLVRVDPRHAPQICAVAPKPGSH